MDRRFMLRKIFVPGGLPDPASGVVMGATIAPFSENL